MARTSRYRNNHPDWRHGQPIENNQPKLCYHLEREKMHPVCARSRNTSGNRGGSPSADQIKHFAMKHNLTSLAFPLLLALLLAQTGCQKTSPPKTPPAATTNASLNMPAPLDPCRIVLLPHHGDTSLDEQIVRAQQAIARGVNSDAALERLGWLFVAKARVSFDGGFYKLAEQCSFALENGCATNSSTDAEAVVDRRLSAMLLRGHVLQNLHQFKAAEPLARELAETRGSPMDFGLLGDVLMEQGRLDGAFIAYQKMMDLRPDSRAYARAAHMRWLKGDLDGAIEAMRDAVSMVGLRDAESAAWMQTRLAFYQFQAGNFVLAQRSCDAALQLQNEYAPALLLRGRMLLVEEKTTEAIEALERAYKLNPLPEYYWALSEALTAGGKIEQAHFIQTMLARRGASDDPRTYSLYLATRHVQPELALRLAREELQQREDVFTYDSLAWAQFANGDLAGAKENMTRALAEHTQDARLYLHAAVISEKIGETQAAENFLKKSHALRHLLWPSERKYLENAMTEVAGKADSGAVATAWPNNSNGVR